MLLSFSVDAMRPMLEGGHLQYLGKDVAGRVKRQTIRQYGPRARTLFAADNPIGAVTTRADMKLHLWWKSRTPTRAFIGDVTTWTVQRITIARLGPGIAIQTDGLTHEKQFDDLAWADGFESFGHFKDYFVPNKGDMFEGVLYKW